MFKCLIILTLSLAALADPLNGSLELGTSISHSHQARSIFSNPSALGFQADLNGSELLSSFTYGFSKDQRSEFSVGLAYGYFGFGVEHLNPVNGEFNRYSFAFGTPLFSQVYLGTRYSFTGSNVAALDAIHSLDMGLQYRASRYVSLGLQWNRLNGKCASGRR